MSDIEKDEQKIDIEKDEQKIDTKKDEQKIDTDKDEQKIDTENNEFEVTNVAPKQNSNAQLHDMFPNFQNSAFGSLPPRSFMFTSLVLFLVLIAGIIVGLSLQVDVVIKVIVILSSAVLLLLYSLFFKYVINKTRRVYLQYAYDYAAIIERDIISGDLHEKFNVELGNLFENDELPAFKQYSVKGHTLMDSELDGKTKNGCRVNLTFSGDKQLNCSISVESEENLALISLTYPTDGTGDKNGYASKPVQVLYDDIIEIVKEKVQTIDADLENE